MNRPARSAAAGRDASDGDLNLGAHLVGEMARRECPSGLISSGGTTSAQIPGTWAIGHRVWNRHPDGGLQRRGDLAGELDQPALRTRSRGSGTGIDESSARVYG